MRAVACDNDTLHVECYDGDTIRVISANYGRRDNVTCSDDAASNVECIHSDTLAVVRSRFAVLFSLMVVSERGATETKRNQWRH